MKVFLYLYDDCLQNLQSYIIKLKHQIVQNSFLNFKLLFITFEPKKKDKRKIFIVNKLHQQQYLKNCKKQLKMNKVIIFFIIIGISLVNSSIYSYSKCSQTQIFNTKTLTCQACPTNKQPNKNQLVPNQCICKKGFYPTDVGACLQYFTSSATACSSNQYINAFNIDGTRQAAASITSCTPCDAKAYQNSNGTGCTPCFTGMKYNSATKKCECIDSTYVQTARGCFPDSYTSILGLTLTSSTYSTQLKYVKKLVPACYYFKSVLQCSQLVNLCTYSLLSSSPQCQFFRKANLTNYLYSQTSNVFKLTTLQKQKQIKMKLVYYLPEGNYVKEKELKFGDIMRCGLPTNTDMTLLMGSNIQIYCDFNFNNLVAQIQGKAYQSYVYQLLVQGQNNNYYEVNVYLNGNTQPVKRFFLEDTYTSTTSVNVLTSMKFQLTLSTDNALINPSLYLGYTKLGLQTGTGITPVSSKTQTLSYIFQFTSQLTGFWSVVLPIFIVVNVLVLVHASIKTYIGYLNRKTPFLFFLNFIDIWSLWIFYFLLITTGYLFIFTKSTSTIYTFISHQNSLYIAFYIVLALMIVFRLVSVIIQKNDKLNIQTFMINWQKSKFRNSWRQIFIVNSLAQFCTYRTFSVFWLMLVMLFFLTGLEWEKHSRQILSTTLSQIYYFHKVNRIYLYFLSCAILLVISIIFKILRRLTVLFWPYPFEDFVDYCSVTNISFFFMKKRSPEAYYIHASIPDKTEVTYKEINHAVRRGLNKTRSIASELNQEGNLKMYILYVNRQVQQKFGQMLKKQEDQNHNRHVKYATGSTVNLKPSINNSKHQFYFREQFIQKRLKSTLQQISQRQNMPRTKSFFESFFHIPPIDLRSQKGLNNTEVIFDDKLDLVKQVFPNGDQFQQLHTIIILYLLWVMVTGSSPIAAFLTYFCDQWILNTWIGSSYRKKLQKMTRVKQGFML